MDCDVQVPHELRCGDLGWIKCRCGQVSELPE